MLNAIFNLNTLWWLGMILYIPACVALIVIVLLQKGKGTGFAGAFGVGGGSDAIFGPRSSKSLPQKLTYLAAAVYMVLALGLSLLSGKVSKGAAPELETEAATVQQSEAVDQLLSEIAGEETTTEAPAEQNTDAAPDDFVPAVEEAAGAAPAGETEPEAAEQAETVEHSEGAAPEAQEPNAQ